MKHKGNKTKDREQPLSPHSKPDLAVMNSTDGESSVTERKPSSDCVWRGWRVGVGWELDNIWVFCILNVSEVFKKGKAADWLNFHSFVRFWVLPVYCPQTWQECWLSPLWILPSIQFEEASLKSRSRAEVSYCIFKAIYFQFNNTFLLEPWKLPGEE